MKQSWLTYAVVMVALSGCAGSRSIQNRNPASLDTMMIQAQDAVAVRGLPQIGKWMIDAHGDVAHWLGAAINGQRLNEPINVVMRLKANNADDANEKLLNSMAHAQYYVRMFHSSGYTALIGNTSMPQFPPTPNRAISDGVAFIPNNHGRIFGPVFSNGYYYYTAAFSREGVAYVRRILGKTEHIHSYSSFNRARDNFAHAMCEDGGAKFMGYIPLENAVTNNPSETTGDHDGQAVFLELFGVTDNAVGSNDA